METKYYTTIKVFGNFCEQLISNLDTGQTQINFFDDESELSIRSTHNADIEKIKLFTRNYPDVEFEVVVNTHDYCCDIRQHYKIKNGHIFFNRTTPIYYFEYSDEVKRMVDPLVIFDFKHEIADLLNRLWDIENSYQNMNQSNNPKKEIISNIELKYSNSHCTLSAKVENNHYIYIELLSINSDDD